MYLTVHVQLPYTDWLRYLPCAYNEKMFYVRLPRFSSTFQRLILVVDEKFERHIHKSNTMLVDMCLNRRWLSDKAFVIFSDESLFC